MEKAAGTGNSNGSWIVVRSSHLGGGKNMGTWKRKMRFLAMGLTFLVLGFFSSEAFPWGFATHAYINEHLGKAKGYPNMDKNYGGVSFDTFNYLFNYPDYQGFLSYQTHNKFLMVFYRANQNEKAGKKI
jgi:hypothetical protein